MISNTSIENLKSYIDIVDVISNYIELKKSGANYKGLCPFHHEDTPSFVVSPSKQIFHCFGCGVGGDSIKFVMEYEKLSYPEAVEKLALEYNFTLEYEKSNYKKQDLSIINSLNQFYQKELVLNKNALEYLKNRGVSNVSIEKFEIGYAPSSNKTIEFLTKNGFNLLNAKEFGLVVENENRFYARFIERITFPIYSTNGSLVGFGGRTITDHPAKYINSPQSKIFNKSKLLYGYHIAKQSIYKKNQIIVTEGYLDVIMLHQAGFDESVATLGTALTKEHIPILKKGDPKIILSYDGDSAGKNAAFKASIMLSQTKCDGGVVIFEDGDDPADLVKESKIEKLDKMFKNPIPFVEYVIEFIASKYDITVPQEKEKALEEILSYIKTLSPILQEEYKEFVASVLKIDKSYIKIKNNKKDKNKKSIISKKEDIPELQIIRTLLYNPQYLDFVLDVADESIFRFHKELFKEVVKNNSLESSLLRDIYFKDEIKIFTFDELKEQINMLLIAYYLDQKKALKNSKNISFDKKAFALRKIDMIIKDLKNKKIVKFEKFI